MHTLRLVRGDGDLHPGSGDPGDTAGRTLGAIVFNKEDANTGRVYVAPGHWRRGGMCRARRLPVDGGAEARGAPPDALPAPASGG